MSRLILVRHTAVHDAYAGICYGAMDVALSEAGREEASRLAPMLAKSCPQIVFHSGLVRSRHLAERIAQAAGVPLCGDDRLRERHFGAWEGRSWNSIHQEDECSLDRLVGEAEAFAPPGGETTMELRDRVMAWYRELPPIMRVIAVTHGGPIAVLLGTLQGCSPGDWPQLIPRLGGSVELP